MRRIGFVVAGALALVLALPVAAQPEPAVRIVFEGDTGGTSSGGALHSIGAYIFDNAVERGAEITVGASDFGTLYHDGRYLLPTAEDSQLSDVLAVLDGSPFERLDSAEVPVLVGRSSVNVLDPLAWLAGQEPPAELRELVDAELSESGQLVDVVEERWRLTVVRNGSGDEALLLESPGALGRALPTEPAPWELRFRYDLGLHWSDGGASNLISLGRRIGEGTRRLRWAGQQRSGIANAVFVSPGNSVEGRSWLEGQPLNLVRPITWEALTVVGLDVLVPAETELAGGVAHLRREAATADVRLISANLFAAGGDGPVFEGSEVREIGGQRVAFVGLTDPDITDALAPDVLAEVRIGPPEEALATQLQSLRTSPEGAPDVVVLLTLLDAQTLDDTLARVPGVDLVIGRGRRGLERDSEVEIRLPPGNAPSEIDREARSPLLRAEAGPAVVGRVDLYTTGGAVTALRLTRRVVDADWEPLSPFVEQISTLRHDLYTAGERTLFPDLDFVRDNPALLEVYLAYADIPPGMSAEQFLDQLPIGFNRGVWLHYLANTVRSWTGTDVALVRVLPRPFALSGPIPKILVDASLGVLDEVVVYRVRGGDLANLLGVRGTLRDHPERLTLDHPPPAASGATYSDLYEVGGRAIDLGAWYTIAMTDQLAAQPDYAAILATYEPRVHFRADRAERTLDSDDDGEALTLHRLAVTDLSERAEEDPSFGATYIAEIAPALAFQGDELTNEFRFRVRALDLLIQQVSARGDRAGFTEVRNTRVTQAESFAFNYVGDLDWIFDLRRLVLTASFESEYGQLGTDGTTPDTETADDLVGGLDFQLRLGSHIAWARAFRPYLTVRYDTEFSPVEVPNDAGGVNVLDRESLLKNSLGLFIDFNDIVPELRLGGIAQTDFAANPTKSQFGAELVLRQRFELGSFLQQLDIEGVYFAPNNQDTLADLRFSLRARLFLGVSLLGSTSNLDSATLLAKGGGLYLATFIDAFVFQGTQPENDNVAATVLFGAGLSYRDLFRWTL